MHKNFRYIVIGVLTVIIATSAGSLWYFFRSHAENAKIFQDTDLAGSISAYDIVTAAGMTENGMDTVLFAMDFMEGIRLCVEEVYVANGDTVAAGEKCIKFTDDSVEKARVKLEKAAQLAELAYQSGALANGESRIQAKHTYDMAVLEAEFAPQVYQDTLTQLEMQLARAEKAYSEAQEVYNAYYLAVENNTFYEDYQIEKRKKAYDDAYDLFISRRQYWEVTEEELRMLPDSDDGAQAGWGDRQWIIRTVALLKEEMAEAKEEYEQARHDYQKEIEGAELKLHKLLNQLEQAKQSYTDAQIEREKGILHAKTTYELTTAQGNLAESEYNARLAELADKLERQKDARNKAAENKELFEKFIGDGYLYAERAGTVVMLQAEKGQALAGGDMVFAYENAEEIFVSAIVPEADCERLFVGEKASVSIAGCGSYDGVIESILPLPSSEKQTNIQNTVMVLLEGDVSAIAPNRAAAVVFGEAAQHGTAQGTASGCGTVKLGTASQMYSLNISSETDEESAAYLKVAEVYVKAGQHIKEGDPVCQFTQNSIESVRKALTYAQSEARIALVQAQTSYHINVLEAGLTHNENKLSAALAQTVYDNTIAELSSGLVEKNLEIEQILADIYQLQLSLTDDNYLEQRADITKAYDKAKKQMEDAREKFVTSQLEAAEAFQAARESYEDFFRQSEVSNQQIADKVEEVYAIQGEILQSRQFLEKKLTEAGQTCSSAQMEGEIANAEYAGRVKEYENLLNKAQADLDRAAKKLDDFNAFIGDGTIYATGDGLVVETGCRKGDLIADTGKLVSFVPAADLTITIGAPQEETAAVNVGDRVNITFAAYEGEVFPGIVKSVSASGLDNSGTTSCPVVISIQGDTSLLYGGMAAEVTFLTGKKEDTQ